MSTIPQPPRTQSPQPPISSADRLDHAAQLMSEHALSHLIVVDAASGRPTGVLSTLDIVAACGA